MAISQGAGVTGRRVCWGPKLVRPYIANAQAKTADVWGHQGLVQEEDVAIKRSSPITSRPAATTTSS